MYAINYWDNDALSWKWATVVDVETFLRLVLKLEIIKVRNMWIVRYNSMSVVFWNMSFYISDFPNEDAVYKAIAEEMEKRGGWVDRITIYKRTGK